jgi:cell division protease FtsH
MSDKLGPLLYSENSQEVFLGHSITQQKNMSEETAKLIDEETRRIVTTGQNTAWEVLTKHKAELEAMAQALMEYETISGEECQAIMRGEKIARRDDDDGTKGSAGSAVPSAGRQPPRPRSEPSGGIDIGPEPQPQG